jgi:hypothetical protein
LKTTTSRAGTALNAVGLSPQFAWTLQLRFWRSTAPPKMDLTGMLVLPPSPSPSPRLGLKQRVRTNPFGNPPCTPESLPKARNALPFTFPLQPATPTLRNSGPNHAKFETFAFSKCRNPLKVCISQSPPRAGVLNRSCRRCSLTRRGTRMLYSKRGESPARPPRLNTMVNLLTLCRKGTTRSRRTSLTRSSGESARK